MSTATPRTANLMVRIPADLHLRARLHALKRQTSLAKLVERALRDLLRRKE